MKYIAYFDSINGLPYRVELDNQVGNDSTEIKLCTNAVIIDYVGEEDIFEPFRLSTATIKLWLSSPIFDIFTGKAKGVKCNIYQGDNII